MIRFIFAFFFLVGTLVCECQTFWKSYTTSNSNLLSNDWKTVCANDTGGVFLARVNTQFMKHTQADTFAICGPTYNYSMRFSTTDKNNDVYVSATGYGIFHYNGVGWSGYDSGNSIPDIVYSTKIMYDTLGNLWVMIWDFPSSVYGLLRISTTGNQKYYTFGNSLLPFDKVQSFHVVDSNNIWIGGKMSDNLAHWDGNTWTMVTAGVTGFPVADISDIQKDSQGNLWAATNGDGLYKFNGTTWTDYTTSNSSICSNALGNFKIDHNDVLWIETVGNGIQQFDGTTFTQYTTSNSPLTTNVSNDIAVDKYNNKWFAMTTGVFVFNETGIVGIDASQFKSSEFSVYPNPSEGIFNLENKIHKNCTVAIYSATGKKVYQGRSDNELSNMELDLRSLEQGIYYLRVVAEGEIIYVNKISIIK